VSFIIHHFAPTYPLAITGNVPQGLPPALAVSCSYDEFTFLLPSAFILALVGFMESISISKKFAQLDGYSLNNSQEFLALGLANLVGSFFGSYPATGSFSRTAIKYNTGSKTQFSAIIAGLVVLCALLFLTPLFYYIPKSALSAVVMAAVVKVFEYERAIEFWHTSKEDFAIFMVTLIGCLGADVDIGIATGVGFSLLVLLFKVSFPNIPELVNVGGNLAPNYRNTKRHPNDPMESNIVIARVDALLFFANVSFVQDKLEKYLIRT